MTELYLNPRASKYLEDYTEFDTVELVNRENFKGRHER